jgi:hypothetical protein
VNDFAIQSQQAAGGKIKYAACCLGAEVARVGLNGNSSRRFVIGKAFAGFQDGKNDAKIGVLH